MLNPLPRVVVSPLCAGVFLCAAIVGQSEPGAAPATPQQSNVSYKPGAGLTIDNGDEFKMVFVTYAQFQYLDAFGSDLSPDQAVSNFLVRRVRPGFTGYIFNRDLLYALRVELTATSSIVKDAWTQWNFAHDADKTIGVRAGQSKTFHGLEPTETDAGLFFVDRTVVTNTFSDVRSRGVWLQGNHGNMLRWTAGAQNGDVASKNPARIIEVGEIVDNPDSDMHYVASFNVDPFGDYVGNGASYESFRAGDLDCAKELRGTIGAGLTRGRGRGTPPAAPSDIDVQSTSLNLNTSWKLLGLYLQTEAYFRVDDSSVGNRNSSGSYAEAGYVMAKSGNSDVQLGFGLRIADVDLGQGFDTRDYTAVFDVFIRGHALKAQLDYTRREFEKDVATSLDSNIVRLQFQIIF